MTNKTDQFYFDLVVSNNKIESALQGLLVAGLLRNKNLAGHPEMRNFITAVELRDCIGIYDLLRALFKKTRGTEKKEVMYERETALYFKYAGAVVTRESRSSVGICALLINFGGWKILCRS